MPKHIIFDLSDTLIRISRLKAVRELGFWDAFTFIVHNMHHPKTLIYDSLYDILNHDEHKTVSNNSYTPLDGRGKPVPLLMQEWFKGEKTSQQLADQVQDLIENYTHFTGTSHKKMVRDTLAWLFDPQRYADSMKPIDDAVELLEDCVDAKNADGSARNDAWILSNFDTETLKYLYQNKRNQPIFKHIPWDHIFISGLMGIVKPDPQIFIRFLQQTKFNPSDCIFIDNQPENIVSARFVGMQAIWLQDADYESVEKQLQSLGAL